ncbi:microcin C transport system substrate-binding protein [Cognatiyoonia koreensis]|uniref:Microcin C transport system substrate-binding protein n=1 Tax=Cognatiyoonia koreensis TaxID=364200 RepID=A0A1I0RBZ7_9RHOB|nr:extracellular solute-binding protein [Cognatiyoonia koreensis]SEW38181.1 microcin C transport system substrate-binding protein [Cognatiyoonia koreensis]
MDRHQAPKAIAKARIDRVERLKRWMLGSAMFIGGALAASAVLSDSHETIIETHAYSTFGTYKYDADFSHLDYVNPEAPKGGEISIWFQGTFDSFNPYATGKGRSGVLATIGYERILTSTADDASASYCLLCTTMEYPENEDWVVFNLRQDITFSDGTPLTAHDLVFSHKLLLEQGTPSYADYVSPRIESAEALDDYTVKFVFADGYPRTDMITLVGSTPGWSKKWYEETGARLDESRLEISPGSGPYILDSFDINRQIIYKRNPDYWGNDLPINIGRNNFDSIRVEYFSDSNAAFEAFKTGEYTFRQESSSLVWATGYDFPALENGWVQKVELPDGSLPSASGFTFNLQRDKFADRRVRQALALMYNFTWTNDTLQYGLFQQRESFWQNSDLEARGVPEGRELELLQSVSDLIDPEVLTEEVTVPHTSGDSQLDRRNLRRALALMEEAGWVADDAGQLRKDGEIFDLEFLASSPTLDRIINPYIENLKRLGINASYNRIDPAQFTNRERSFDWDMTLNSYSNGLEESIGLSQRYGTEAVGDVFNPASFGSEAVDKLIEEVVNAETYEDMAAGVRAIDRLMRRELFMIPVWYLGNHWVAYYDMYEYPDELPPYSLGHIDFWWYNAEKAEALRAAGAFK